MNPLVNTHQNPFLPTEDGSAMLAEFIRSQPPYIRKNLGDCCEQRDTSTRGFLIKSDGECLTFFGRRNIIRIGAKIPRGFYSLKGQNIRMCDVYPRAGIIDIDIIKPPLHHMWERGKLFPMTGEQAGEIIKFMQYGSDNHKFSSYIFSPTRIYAATAATFELPIQTNLNMRIDISTMIVAFTEMMRYPSFLVGTHETTESGHSIHEETVLFCGINWENCVIAACDSVSL